MGTRKAEKVKSIYSSTGNPVNRVFETRQPQVRNEGHVHLGDSVPWEIACSHEISDQGVPEVV